MGSTSDEEGESNSRQNSPEGDDERPLKKARFAWQIKGNHPLKDKRPNFGNSSKYELTDDEPQEILENSPLNEDEPFITTMRNPDLPELLAPASPTQVILPTFPILCNPSPSTDAATSKAENDPTCWLSSLRLRCWQTKQLARGLLDNTMNQLRERMDLVPRQPRLEDAAVMMAIQHHGLFYSEQQEDHNIRYCEDGIGRDIRYTVHRIPTDKNQTNIRTNLSVDKNPTSAEDCGSADQSVDAVEYNKQSGEDVALYEISGASDFQVENHSSSSKSEMQDLIETMSQPDASTISSMNTPRSEVSMPSSLNTHQPEVSMVDEESSNLAQPAALSQLEHDNFLDAAVAVAIQKKGLSVLACAESR